MSTDGRKGFVLVAATVAILALAAVMVFAASTNLSGATRNDEAQSGDEAHEADVVKLGKVTKNKGKSDPGMCVYSATNRYTFKNVPKGDFDQNDSVLNELDRGGEFADSQTDCDELNAGHTNLSREEHGDPDIVADQNLTANKKPPGGQETSPPSETIRAQKAFEERHADKNNSPSKVTR